MASTMLPRSGITRSLVLWYRTRTRFEKGMAALGLGLVLWAIVIIYSSSWQTTSAPQHSLTELEVESLRAAIREQERAKYESEKQQLLASLKSKESDVEARLQDALAEQNRLDELLRDAEDANKQDESAMVELRDKQQKAVDEISKLKSQLSDMHAEAKTRIKASKQQMRSRIESSTLVSVSRHSAHKLAQQRLEEFCTAHWDVVDPQSPVDVAVGLDGDHCIGTVPAVHSAPVGGGGGVLPPVELEGLVAQLDDARVATALATLAVPVLQNKTDVFAGAVVPIDEYIASGQCCSSVMYMAHPTAGMFYRMKLPVMSMDSIETGGSEDQPIAFRSACFRRPWSPGFPTLTNVDPPQLGAQEGGGAGGKGSMIPERTRPSITIIVVVGSRSMPQLPWVLRSLRRAVQHAARTGARLDAQLVVVVGRGPPVVFPGPAVAEDADAVSHVYASEEEFQTRLEALRRNITTFQLGLPVRVIAPLDSDSRTAEGLFAATRGWDSGGTAGGVGAGVATPLGRVWAQSPWLAAAAAGFAEVKESTDIGVLLDPATMLLPEDLLLQVAAHTKQGLQGFAPIMSWVTAADAQAATVQLHGGVAAAKAAAVKAAAASTAAVGEGNGLRGSTGDEQRRLAPYVTTLAVSKGDMAALLRGVVTQPARHHVPGDSGSADGSMQYAKNIAGTGTIKAVDCAALQLLSAAERLKLRVVRSPLPDLLLAPGRGHKGHAQEKSLKEGLQALRAMCGCTNPNAGGECATEVFQTHQDSYSSAFQVACALSEERRRAGVSSNTQGSSDGDETPGTGLVAGPRLAGLDAQWELTHQRVVDAATAVHSRLVDNVVHSNTFLDPLTGVSATAVVSECAFGSAHPNTCPAPTRTQHSHGLAVAPWLSVEWQLSDDVVPQHSLLSRSYLESINEDAGDESASSSTTGGGVDDDDEFTDDATRDSGGPLAWLKSFTTRGGDSSGGGGGDDDGEPGAQ